jgi:hypothetical protein
MQIKDNGKCKKQCEQCKEYYKDLELLKHKEFIIKLENQLSEWMDGCDINHSVFSHNNMISSAMTSEAMKVAYNNVKTFIKLQYEKTT